MPRSWRFGPPFKITNVVSGITVPINPSLLTTTITGMPPISAARWSMSPPRTFRTPFTYSYSLNLQRQIGAATIIQASYIGALGRHLIRMQPLNLIDPATGVAPNPNFSDPGALELIETDGISSYNALQANIRQRIAHGLEFTASLYLGAFARRCFQRHPGLPSTHPSPGRIRTIFTPSTRPAISMPATTWWSHFYTNCLARTLRTAR